MNPMLNMNISESQITIRSQTYNTLRPRIGTMLHKNNLIGQGIYIWNKAPQEFKMATNYEKAKKLANKIAKTYPLK